MTTPAAPPPEGEAQDDLPPFPRFTPAPEKTSGSASSCTARAGRAGAEGARWMAPPRRPQSSKGDSSRSGPHDLCHLSPAGSLLLK
jgi:hypothetical protein